MVPDFKQTTMLASVTQHVTPGSTIYTDGLKGFEGVPAAGVRHVFRTQPLRIDLRKGTPSVVPLADRANGNLQQWLIDRSWLVAPVCPHKALGPRQPRRNVVIAVGVSPEALRQVFGDVVPTSTLTDPIAMPYEREHPVGRYS